MRDRYASLREGLVGAWIPSVSGSGLLLPDLSGNGNNGALTNMGPEDWVSSQYGRALDFDGSNDYVEIADSPKLHLNTGDLTICVWLKLRAASTAIVVSKLFSTGFEILSFGGYLEGFVANVSGGASSVVYYTLNTWHHVTLTRKNGICKLILDGGVTAGAEWNSAGSVSSVGNNLYISKRPSLSGFSINGNTDDIRIYNRALSPSEIKQLYEGGPGYGLRQERKRTRFQVQGFNAGRFRRQQLIGTGVY